MPSITIRLAICIISLYQAGIRITYGDGFSISAASSHHQDDGPVGSTLSSLSTHARRAGRLPPLSTPVIDVLLPYQLSSPERYAAAMNMTVKQVKERKDDFKRASDILHEQVLLLKRQSRTPSGASYTSIDDLDDDPSKAVHTLICQHRYEWGQHPFVCPRCWTYTPICVCRVAESHHIDRRREGTPTAILSSSKSWLPSNLDVVIWTHHKEYGLTSNTGGLLPLLLDDRQSDDGKDVDSLNHHQPHRRCYVLMKGLPDHDSWLQHKIIDKHESGEYLVVVLWPSDERKQQQEQQQQKLRSISLDETKRILLETQRRQQQQDEEERPDSTTTTTISRVVLIAVDGTWRNARRMVSRLPNVLPRLDLSATTDSSCSTQIFPVDGRTNNNNKSLLAPIRSRGPSQRKDGGAGLVCTAEAVTAALVALGLEPSDGERILDLARTKVDLVRQYRGHESKVK